MVTFNLIIGFLLLNFISVAYSLKTTQRQDVLRYHNRFRRDLATGKVRNKDGKLLPKAKNMYEFKYNLILEKIAEKTAKLCEFKHSTPKARKFSGETIYTFTKPVKIKEVLDNATAFWWQELEDFGIDRNLNLTRFEFDKGIGHFTQMAWGSTTSVGCAVRYCRNKGEKSRFTLVFCNYSPAGNILNNPIYEVGKPCKNHSNCTSYEGSKCMGKKRGGLCRRI